MPCSAYTDGSGTHQVQHRLQQVDVDDLTPPLCKATIEANAAASRSTVGQRHRRQERLTVGLAVDGAKEPIASAIGAKPGRAT